jgi:hypothetical protein
MAETTEQLKERKIDFYEEMLSLLQKIEENTRKVA